ncbi:MAG: c-type cytochrome [Gemmatimonadaceae bacterium]
MRQRLIAAAVMASAAIVLAGAQRPSRAPAPAGAPHVPAGEWQFVAHDEHIQPFGTPRAATPSLVNPFEHNASALAQGKKLFVGYNCMDCHGADGSGFMAPSLADGRWHFGGAADEVFESIYQGRPDGMPAWGGRISNDDIWRLVTYVRSLGGADVSTENFTGQEVERSGH